MVTTRNGALKDRRVTRSMAAPISGSPGTVKREAPAAPKKGRSNTASQKDKKLASPKRGETEESYHGQTSNENSTARPTTTSMVKDTNLNKTATPKSTFLASKKSSANASKFKKASARTSRKPSSRLDASAISAARPTTRSMVINHEDPARAAPSRPPTHAGRNLTAPSRRVTRQMASQNAISPVPTNTSTPIDDAQSPRMSAIARTTDPPRARRKNTRITITSRVIRPGLTVTISAGQERYWIARARASLRRALEGNQEWSGLTHGQRREMIRMFAWVETQPGRTHHDYFNLPIRHEALTTRPMVNMLGIISRVRAWYESLKTGTNDEEEEAVDDEGNGVTEED